MVHVLILAVYKYYSGRIDLDTA